MSPEAADVNMRPRLDLPFMQKPSSLLDTAFDLYGFLPEDGDPRWDFLSRYDAIRDQVGFRAMNFDNAWQATYLSDAISYQSGFTTSINPENCLQLDRALDNLSLADEVRERYEASHEGYGKADMRLTLTDSLTTDPTKPKQPVTPCPEALYQIRLYDGQYLARVGFNLHLEAGSKILSLVNIQGTPDGVKRNAAFEAAFGTSPFNLLVRRVLALAGIESPAYQVRGMINPERGNPQLYWGVLQHEGVEMHHAHRKLALSIFPESKELSIDVDTRINPFYSFKRFIVRLFSERVFHIKR